LLLEIAHPLVAAGVAEHSNFRGDPFGRLQRTLGAMRAITFGDRTAGFAAVRAIERAHAVVHGTLAKDVGIFRAGTAYSASDPESMRWVWATLVETAVTMHRRFVGELASEAVSAYYADHLGVARLLGIPAAILPASWTEFETWFDDTIAGDALAVDERARDIADAVLQGSLPAADAKVIRILTTGLLPERLRRAFGLEWNDAKAERFAKLIASVRGLRSGAAALDGESEPG
jgi:uncharacterized protein (DUF2236 family)